MQEPPNDDEQKISGLGPVLKWIGIVTGLLLVGIILIVVGAATSIEPVWVRWLLGSIGVVTIIFSGVASVHVYRNT